MIKLQQDSEQSLHVHVVTNKDIDCLVKDITNVGKTLLILRASSHAGMDSQFKLIGPSFLSNFCGTTGTPEHRGLVDARKATLVRQFAACFSRAQMLL